MRYREYSLEEKLALAVGWGIAIFSGAMGLLLVVLTAKVIFTGVPHTGRQSNEAGGLVAPGVPKTNYGQKGSNDGRQR